MSNENTLDLLYVHESFKKSLKDDDDVEIESYIDGYNELVKFLNLIGTVFSFVSSDVRSKIKIMEKLRVGEASIYYESFKKMMKYEKETNLYEKNDFIFGSEDKLTEAMSILPQTLQSCDEVYQRVHQLYADFAFHDLP
ncbi:unnamed protein product [Leptidea sinapis]|uniref:Glycolipid transfer protein domain-containing protein n=1 Tax=Leptidea sinapis TaxID=189913 RepID=A0A5E4Q7W8_9NEOP|nr:unnamed protein product [Leptidea sinapis]